MPSINLHQYPINQPHSDQTPVAPKLWCFVNLDITLVKFRVTDVVHRFSKTQNSGFIDSSNISIIAEVKIWISENYSCS